MKIENIKQDETTIGGGADMKLVATQAAEQKLLLQTYDRHPILLTRGEGVHLFDDAGNKYLDLLSGIGVSALGYGHAAITRAMTAQAATLLHTSNLFYHDGTATLAVKLTELTGMDRVFFCNSGTEAWEAALKLARAHAGLLRAEGKTIGTRFIAMEHSFHGRTMGSVATTHKLKYREPFAPVMPDVIFVPFNEVDALRAAFTDDVCAIALECLQGEGGIHPVSQEFLAAARELCDSTGALLLCDEIQSGMGRTGKWMSYQHYGIQPDVTTLAKPLAGGLPMGAMLCTEEAARAITPGMHGTTFGGGPLVCAVAIAVIDEINRANLLAHVSELGSYFVEELRGLAKEHDSIVEVRGTGFMIGVEIQSAELAKELADRMMFERHIILNRTSETVLRFLPPFLITKEHVDETIAALGSLLQEASAAQTVLAGEQVHG
ncbi:aspartate aminotransferase family protein [Terriglobus roseus]|uniref:Acetylornithine aminotransferase n=1 Tax=Terriglobus roseus TaxID=392734 RepID=A0A1H4U1I0_9BACT|nr:aspartate aminotransferase family protein [Terriglobus roseus]SEC62562.1 acetylornithine aminotransferase/acetylornithine/N-succinyldiaminopimelate aminotransferase [Terriglobus roseus]